MSDIDNLSLKKKTVFYNGLHAFTLIELIVVLSVIGVLASFGLANFGSNNEARRQARDDIRMSQLEQLRVAIELYKSENGRYPAMGCTSGNGWNGPGPQPTGGPCEEDNYILGLVPNFISALPQDPNRENENHVGFLYRVTPSGNAYKVLSHVAVESKFVDSYPHPFARCPRSFGSSYCGATGPQNNTYAIYSAGAESW